MSRKTLRRAGALYLLKCLLVLTAWMAIPDLPHRAAQGLRTVLSHLAP
jgi:hypothetical protein